ncbi:MAG: hypothetical protein Q9215_002767 [Flavoplaca cf. flavocitrina]
MANTQSKIEVGTAVTKPQTSPSEYAVLNRIDVKSLDSEARDKLRKTLQNYKDGIAKLGDALRGQAYSSSALLWTNQEFYPEDWLRLWDAEMRKLVRKTDGS